MFNSDNNGSDVEPPAATISSVVTFFNSVVVGEVFGVLVCESFKRSTGKLLSIMAQTRCHLTGTELILMCYDAKKFGE